jgi:acetoin utilization protein AcuC
VPRAPAVTVVWDDQFLSYDLGPSHPFTEVPRQLGADLAVRWAAEAGVPVDLRSTVGPATPEELTKFHTATYLRTVARAAERGDGAPLDQGDTPSFPGCDRAAAQIVGGTLAAFASVRGDGPRRTFQPGGGLHHARPDRASGFCIYNDIAVALANGFADGSIRRAAYIDIDVHHGDGVMYGFYNDGRLLNIDFHQDGRTIFPGTGGLDETGRGDGAGLKVNVPLPPGAGDAEFRFVWDRVVPHLLEEFRPDLIVLQCGVDGHEGDRLGQLRYRAATYDRALRGVMAAAERRSPGALVVTGGGGYDASNVALTLGLAGRRLAGGPPTGPSEPLPARWPEEFRDRTGSSPPSCWETIQNATANSAVGESLVRRLGTALGRKFPTPGDPTT